MEANWCFGSLSCSDMNKTLANVYSFVFNATGYTNLPRQNPADELHGHAVLRAHHGVEYVRRRRGRRSHLCRIRPRRQLYGCPRHHLSISPRKERSCRGSAFESRRHSKADADELCTAVPTSFTPLDMKPTGTLA
ncbi:hypothetical protein H4582DRAFT_1212631 [Lactarius indigo]|nr:hypothetical protein H4582DRAFT_1212631 [Lactarius indigo]